MFIHAGVDLVAIEHQRDFHGGMADALVGIDKGMIADKRVPQRGGFSHETRIEILPAERHVWLGYARFQRAPVPNALAAA